MSESIVDVHIPLSPEELSAQHMKQQQNYAEFLAAERDLWPNFFAPTWHTYTPPEEQ